MKHLNGCKITVALSLLFIQPANLKAEIQNKVKPYVLPEKNELPVTLESFCAGVPNVTAITKQQIEDEIAVFCDAGNNPTQTLRDLAATPYEGVGIAEDFVIVLPSAQDIPASKMNLNIAYAIRIKKSAAKALIAEEPNALVPYASNSGLTSLSIGTKFITPSKNEGDADTTFAVEQTVDVLRLGIISFKDISTHTLSMYRIQPNNLDFFLAARTLDTSETVDFNGNGPNGSKQFDKANVVRGVMTDPNDPTTTLIFSTINIVMNSRSDETDSLIYEGMGDAFTSFLNQSLVDAYQAHQ